MKATIYSNFHNVDAGILGIFKVSWIKRNKGIPIVSFHLKKDSFIKLIVLNTWHGTISSRSKLLRTGEYYVGDPGYIFTENWDLILSKTDYFNNIPRNCIRLNTGGDGSFMVEIMEVNKNHIMHDGSTLRF